MNCDQQFEICWRLISSCQVGGKALYTSNGGQMEKVRHRQVDYYVLFASRRSHHLIFEINSYGQFLPSLLLDFSGPIQMC